MLTQANALTLLPKKTPVVEKPILTYLLRDDKNKQDIMGTLTEMDNGLFDNFDKNNDGIVTTDEVGSPFAKKLDSFLGNDGTFGAFKLAAFLLFADKNLDGDITESELKNSKNSLNAKDNTNAVNRLVKVFNKLIDYVAANHTNVI